MFYSLSMSFCMFGMLFCCCFVVFALAQGYVGYVGDVGDVLGASFGRRRCSATMRDHMG